VTTAVLSSSEANEGNLNCVGACYERACFGWDRGSR
jgi:hypothetical protein